jgi:thiamine-monophosphate kinase
MRSKRTGSSISDNNPGELDLIRQIRARAAQTTGAALRMGIGDDCALLRPRPGEELAVTTDLTIAGRHFRLDWHPPESIGHRALARGLSDLAAMGAHPIAAFLSLGLPRELTALSGRRTPWVHSFLDGLLGLASAYKTPLAGGDLAESPIPIADVVLIGAVPRGRALLRSTARPGHLLYVTGSLGGAAAALAKLELLQPHRIPKKLAAQLAPHLYPQPRIAQGEWLVRHGNASAAIDLSDGLSTDLAHLCQESHVAAEIDAALLPVHPAATLAQALNGGEDYELLFTAPATARLPKSISGVPITRIGRILPVRRNRPTVTLLSHNGPQTLNPQGWQHFS